MVTTKVNIKDFFLLFVSLMKKKDCKLYNVQKENVCHQYHKFKREEIKVYN